MSNSNNPFSEENNKNENNEQSNNKAMNVSAKFLEEAPPNAAPPPAYEDVVKPQPTLPAYSQNNQSYLPPPFPSPAESYNQTNLHASPVNSNKTRVGHRGCCCCCFPNRNRNKNCGCGWIIVFVIFIILTTISVANNNACRKLPMGNVQKFSFDPTDTILDINVVNARIRGGDVRIFQGQPTQQLVDIEVLTGTKGVTPKLDTLTQNGVYELIISQTSGFSIFNIPPRCMKMQINVYLPFAAPSTTIKVKDLDLIMTNNGIKFDQSITLITEDGDIIFNNTSADKINIKSVDGNIGGIITSLSNELSISTVDGNVGLFLGIAPGVNDAKINIDTNDGNVELRFRNSFLGTYDILSRDGRIRINDNNNTLIDENRVVGSINGGGNNLNITTDDGNVGVLF